MSMSVKVGRKKAVVLPPKVVELQYPYLAKHTKTGEIYLMVGKLAGHPNIPSHMRDKILVQNLTGPSAARSSYSHMFEPYYEPLTLQTVKP